ncbi:hypothetical protein RIR_jg11024.t1 [Rhizophagus irregularis DAOM 181602=DAOM 197198]|nr:hypothetical protein RIR_jg11024.t1 [Rhizophagus irregularis DAOM 181602=DAOM 197198]
MALKNELGYYWTQDFGFGDGLGLQILALKNATNVPFPFFSLGMYSDITGLKISVLEDRLGFQILALK